MANNDSDGKGPQGGRRPAPQRPASRRAAPPRRPAAPAPEDEEFIEDEEKTQAINLADFNAAFIDDGDNTASAQPAALNARAAQKAAAAQAEADEDDEEDEDKTVAMQLPEGFLDAATAAAARKQSNRTLLGHPGLGPRGGGAVRGAGAATPNRNQTLAMDTGAIRAAATLGPSDDDDDDESTQAINVDDMLAKIDAHAEDEADDESTQAMNVDDMLSKIDAPAAAAPVYDDEEDEEDEDAATMAVDMSDISAEFKKRNAAAMATHDDDDDDGDKTVAMNISMPSQAKRPVAAVVEAAAPVAAAAAGSIVALAPALGTDGFFTQIGYALAYDGRKEQIDDGLAAVDGAIASGKSDHSQAELKRLQQQYKSEKSALDDEAAKQGWIKLGIVAGGATVLITVLGVIF
ncbi:MAG: hypothetical protein ACI9MR_002034 [Myxococcota bacterium]|jgi:hypothetical protein